MKNKNVIWIIVIGGVVLIVIFFLWVNFLLEKESSKAAMDLSIPQEEIPINPEEPIDNNNPSISSKSNNTTSNNTTSNNTTSKGSSPGSEINDTLRDFMGDSGSLECVALNVKKDMLLNHLDSTSSSPIFDEVAQRLDVIKYRINNAPSSTMGDHCQSAINEIDEMLLKVQNGKNNSTIE